MMTVLKIAGGMLLLMFLLLSIRFVDTGEIGVIREWGKMTERTLNPGANFIMPFRDSAITFNLRIKKDQVETSAASKDMQEVAAIIAVNYHISKENVFEIYENIGDDDLLNDKIIAPSVQEVVKACISDYKAAELLVNREDVKVEIDRRLTERLSPYWIEVDDVSIVNLDFSSEFNAAIEAKQVAEQEAEQAKYEVEQAKQEMEKIKLLTVELNDNYLKKVWIEKWNGQLPNVVAGEDTNLIYGIN